MNTLTALPDGATTNDARLEDICNGYDNTVYNSPGESVRNQISDVTDKISGIRDVLGFQPGNKYKKFIVEQGHIDAGQGGKDTDSIIRVRVPMNNAFEYDVFTAMTVINKDPTTYRCAINIFNKDDSLKSALGWRNDESYTYALESDYKYRFVFSKIDNSSITVNEVNNNFEYIIGKYSDDKYNKLDSITQNQNNIETYIEIDIKPEINEIKDTLGFQPENTYKKFQLEQGHLMNGVETDTNSRVRSTADSAFITNTAVGITVINKNTSMYKCFLCVFNKLNDSFVNAYGWRNDESYTYALESDYKYRFVFANHENTAVTVDEIDENFEYIIGKYTEKTYKRIDMIDKIIKVQNQISKSAPFISIAHQGYHSIYANQTLDAYKAAGESTFNWVECDLKVTSDGVVICSHNETVYADETTMQINPVIGSANNVYNTAIEISSISYDDLCMYDIAKWKNEDLPSQTFPTLENVIKIAKYYNMGLVIDHLFALNRLNNWDVLKNLIQQYGMENKIALTSTSQYISENCPNVKYFSTCVESTYSSVLQSLINFKNTYGSDCYLNILKTALTDEIKTTTRNNGIGLMVWTINDLNEYKNYLTNYYLDGFTSDYYNYYDIP